MKVLKRALMMVFAMLTILLGIYASMQPSYEIKTEGTLYAVNKGEKSVTIFDLEEGKSIKTLSMQLEPHEATYVAGSKSVVVTDYGSSEKEGKSVTIINTATNSIEKTISLGASSMPHGIITMPNSNSVGVVTDIGNHLSIVNLENQVVEKQMGTGQDFSHLLVHHPQKPLVYVTNINSGSVSVMDLSEERIEKIIPLGTKTEGIAITPDGSELWVTHIEENTVSVIDTETYETVAKLSTGKLPLRIKITADGKYGLVSNTDEGTVSVYSIPNRSHLKTIALPGSDGQLDKLIYGQPRPVGILMHPNGLYAFVSNYSQERVEVIDLKNFIWNGSIKVGNRPDGLAWVPTSN
jgi:YVTN family beta-propeller protein